MQVVAIIPKSRMAPSSFPASSWLTLIAMSLASSRWSSPGTTGVPSPVAVFSWSVQSRYFFGYHAGQVESLPTATPCTLIAVQGSAEDADHGGGLGGHREAALARDARSHVTAFPPIVHGGVRAGVIRARARTLTVPAPRHRALSQ